MARAGMPEPFSWEHVRGKTIVGARLGGVPEMVLEWVLKKHGIEPFKDVKIITSLASRRRRALQPGWRLHCPVRAVYDELEMAGRARSLRPWGF